MLLPASADLLLLGVAVFGLVGTLAYVIRGGRLFWVVVGGTVFTLLFTLFFFLSVTITCKVVRVSTRGTAELHATRALLIGSTTLDLGGREVTLRTGDAETLIVNESDRPLTLRGEVYSQFRTSSTAQPRDLTIAPRSIVAFDDFVDHLGPDDPLPRTVSSKSSTVTQYWLTW